MYRDEICKCHSTSVFLFLSVYNSFILFFELKEFREDQFTINLLDRRKNVR